MAIQHAHYKFDRTDYHRMAEAGIIADGVRVELIDGEILEMSPIGRRHNVSVARLNRLFSRGLGDAAIVWVQSSIVLGNRGEPEPDIALLRPREDFYADSEETPEDILLIVEVADTSEAYDRLTKAPLYARYGIPEFWIVNINRDQIVAYREPTPHGYATTQVYRRGESISPLAFPDLSIQVADVVG